MKPDNSQLDAVLAILDEYHCIVTDELGKECAEAILANYISKEEVKKAIGEDEKLKDVKNRSILDAPNERY